MIFSAIPDTPNNAVQLIGPEKVLGTIYDQIGYSQIPDDGLKAHKMDISPYRAIELTRNMYQVEIMLSDSKIQQGVPLKLTDEQQKLYQIFQ